MIISVSRRTDLPAYYTPWFMERVRAQKAVYYNPFNYQGYEISLAPKDVDLFFFLSKNYAPLIPHIPELKKDYHLYFHYTITGLHTIFEENVPDMMEMVDIFCKLAALTSPEQIQWRFDPILLTTMTPPEFYIDRFERLASALAGATRRCYFSFATIYNKVERNFWALEKKGIKLLHSEMSLKKELAGELARIGQQYGIQLYSCCNDFLVDGTIQKAHCIDGEYLGQLFGLENIFRDGPTRDECGCVKSIDLGVYDTCPHGCVYCYANVNKKTAQTNYETHQKEEELLIQGRINVVKRLPVTKQLSLFQDS